MIPVEAVEAAAKALAVQAWGEWEYVPDELRRLFLRDAQIALEAAAPHMLAELDLMRWKLDALKEWSDAMVEDSYYPQYGRDVRSLLEVGSMDQAREIDAL